MDAGRSRKKPPGKPSIFNVRVPTADVADFGRSTGKAGGTIVGAALGVEVVEAMLRRWWSSSALAAVKSMSIHVKRSRTSSKAALLAIRPQRRLELHLLVCYITR